MTSRFKNVIKRLYQSTDTASNQSTEEEIYSDDILPDLKDIKIGKRIYSGKDLENIASKDHVGLFKKVFQNMYPITRTKYGLPKKPRNPSQKENLVQRLKNKFNVLRFDIQSNIKVKGDSTTLRESIEHLEDIKQLINHFEENNTTTFPYDLLETYIENSDIDLFSDDIDEEMSKSYIKQKENTRIKNLLRQFAKIYLQDEYKSNYDLYDPGMSKGKFENYLAQADQKKLVPVTLGNLIRFLRDDYTSKSSSDADYSKLLQWIDDVHRDIIDTKIPEETQEVILNGLLAELQNLRNPPAQVGGDLTSDLVSKKTGIQEKIKELVSKYTIMKTKYQEDIRFTLGEITKHKGVAINCQAQLDAALQREATALTAATGAASQLEAANAKFNELSAKIKLIKSRLNLGNADATDSVELILSEQNLNSIECQINALKEAKETAERAATAATTEKDAAIKAKSTLEAEALAEKNRRDAADAAAALQAALALTEANARVDQANDRAAAAEARLAELTNQQTTTGESVNQAALNAAQAEAARAREDLAAAQAEAAAARADADAARDDAERAQAQIEATKAEALANIEAADAAAQSMIAATQTEAQGKIAAAQAEAEAARAEAERQIAAAQVAAREELSAARAAAQVASREGIAEAEAAAQARIAVAQARVSDLEAQVAAAAERATAAAADAASDKERALNDARSRSDAALEALRNEQTNALNELRASHLAKMNALDTQNKGNLAEIDKIKAQMAKSTAQITLLLNVLESTKNMALVDAENSIQSIYDTLMGIIADLSNFDAEGQQTIKQHIEVIKKKLISLIKDKGALQAAAAVAAQEAVATAAAVAAQAAADAAQISSLEGEASAATTAAQNKAREAAAAAEDAKRLRDSLAASAANLSSANDTIKKLEAQIQKLLSSQARMNNPTMPILPTPTLPTPTLPTSIYNPSSPQGQQGQPVQQSSTIEEIINSIFKDREIQSYLPGYRSNTTILSNLLKRLDQFGLFTAKIRAMIAVKSITKDDDYDNLTIFIDGTQNMVNKYIKDYVNKQSVSNKANLNFRLSNDPLARTDPYYKYELLPTVLINQLDDENALKTLVEKMMAKLEFINKKIIVLSSSQRAANPRVYSQRGGLHSMSLDIANNRYNNNLLEETNPFYSIIEKFDKSSNTNMIARANETIMMERFLDTMLKDHFTDIEMKEFFFEATKILDKKSCDDISTLCFELLEICKIVELSDKNIDVIKLENTSLNVDFDKLENKIKECPYDFFEQAKKHFPTKKEISIGFFKDAIYFYLETDKFDKTYIIDKQNELHLANFDFNEEIYYVNNHMLYLFFIICNKIITKQKFAELDSYVRKQKRSKTKRMSTLLKERKEIN